MFDAAQLFGFVAAVAVLVVVPGPATMVIVAHGLGGKARVGLAAVAGVETGTVVHTLAAAAGLSAVVAASPLALIAVQYFGAAYLVFEGVRIAAGRVQQVALTTELTVRGAYRRALLTNVFNPKTALFFLAFLPQFIRPERGRLFLQFVILGLVVSLVGMTVGSMYALAAGSIADWLRHHAGFERWQRRVTGGVLIAVAVRLMTASTA